MRNILIGGLIVSAFIYLANKARAAYKLDFEPMGVDFAGFTLQNRTIRIRVRVLNEARTRLSVQSVIGKVLRNDTNDEIGTVLFTPATPLIIAGRGATIMELPVMLSPAAVTLLSAAIVQRDMPPLRFVGSVESLNVVIPVNERIY